MRDKLADCLKGYACFLVVFGHVLLGLRNASWRGITIPRIVIGYEEYIWTFHVSLFMFLSGYVYRKCGLWEAKGSRQKFILYKLFNLGIPYLVFSVVYICINYIMSSNVNTEYSLTDILFLWKTPIAQNWFLYSLFLLFTFFVVLSKWLKIWQITIILGVISCVSSFAGISLGSFESPLKLALVFGLGVLSERLYIGEWNNKNKVMLFIVFTVIGSLVIITNMNAFWIGNQLARISGIVASISIISITIKVSFFKHLLLKICKYSFPIYLLHTIFTAGIRIAFLEFGIISYIVHVLVGLFFGFACPIVIALICERIIVLNIFFYPSRTLKSMASKSR